MDSLDKKAFEMFSGRVVPKGATKKIKDSANVPTYVLEYLLGTYCTSDDEQEIEAGIEQVKRILADLVSCTGRSTRSIFSSCLRRLCAIFVVEARTRFLAT